MKVIRERLKLSQEDFADRYGFSVGTLKNWEQSRRVPEGAARILLGLIDSQPKLIERELLKRVRELKTA